MGNKNLQRARKAKNDEFYTQLTDIEKEVFNYKDQLKGKVIFCNCDDPKESNFWKYFKLNFEFFELKKLISTHYKEGESTYKLEYDGKKEIETSLTQNGDFRSPESIELLKEADIVITNPPFSLFREYIGQLIEYNKDFLVIGNNNAITYKEIFLLLKENKMWLGYSANKTMEFQLSNDYEKWDRIDEEGNKFGKVPAISWFTNLEVSKRQETMKLYSKYNKKHYPKYDNYDAINIDKVAEIPVDYDGVMGVPITFITRYNPEQFKIVALGIVGSCEFTCNKKMEILDKFGIGTGKFTTNAKGTLYRKYNPEKDKKAAFKDCKTGELYSSIYARVLIQKRKETSK